MLNKQEKWDRRFLDLALLVSSWSKDPSSKVGAAIVDGEGRVLGTGYNGLPRGVEDLPERLENREHKYPMIAHAELNAILGCTLRPKKATLYVTPIPPCSECTKAIIQSGIHRLVIGVTEKYKTGPWREQFDRYSKVMLDESGVNISMYEFNEGL